MVKSKTITDELSYISNLADWNSDKKREDFANQNPKFTYYKTLEELSQGIYNLSELIQKHSKSAFLSIEEWSEVHIKIQEIESETNYVERLKSLYRDFLKQIEQKKIDKKLKEQKEYEKYLALKKKFEH